MDEAAEEGEAAVVAWVVAEEGISVVAAVLAPRWEVLRPSIGHRLRRLDRPLRPRGPMWEAEALVRVIGRPFNRDHGQAAELPLVQDQRRSPVLGPVEERGLVRDKASVPARAQRIVLLRVPDKGSRIEQASRNNQQRGCLDWVPAQRRELRQDRLREIARRIDRRPRKIAEPV